MVLILSHKQPEATIAILAATDSDELLFSAITCGVKGFILKNTPLEKFLASLRALERGEAAFSRTMTGRIIQEFARLAQQRAGAESELSLLTPREQEVLRLLAQEATNREIADKLVISENTVKVHIHNILEKLNLHNRREATRFARRSSLAMVNQNSLL